MWAVEVQNLNEKTLLFCSVLCSQVEGGQHTLITIPSSLVAECSGGTLEGCCRLAAAREATRGPACGAGSAEGHCAGAGKGQVELGWVCGMMLGHPLTVPAGPTWTLVRASGIESCSQGLCN